MADSDNLRSRLWGAVIYPEDESHCNMLKVLEEKHFQYAGIMHSSDVDDDGNLKKAHWHIVIYLPNARWRDALAKELGIMQNYLQVGSSFRSMCRYLIHIDNPDKYQYDLSDVFGTLASKVHKFCDDSSDEDARIIRLLSLLDSLGYISFSDFTRLICKNGLYADWRRLGVLGTKILTEHNELHYKDMFDESDAVSKL